MDEGIGGGGGARAVGGGHEVVGVLTLGLELERLLAHRFGQAAVVLVDALAQQPAGRFVRQELLEEPLPSRADVLAGPQGAEGAAGVGAGPADQLRDLHQLLDVGGFGPTAGGDPAGAVPLQGGGAEPVVQDTASARAVQALPVADFDVLLDDPQHLLVGGVGVFLEEVGDGLQVDGVLVGGARHHAVQGLSDQPGVGHRVVEINAPAPTAAGVEVAGIELGEPLHGVPTAAAHGPHALRLGGEAGQGVGDLATGDVHSDEGGRPAHRGVGVEVFRGVLEQELAHAFQSLHVGAASRHAAAADVHGAVQPGAGQVFQALPG